MRARAWVVGVMCRMEGRVVSSPRLAWCGSRSRGTHLLLPTNAQPNNANLQHPEPNIKPTPTETNTFTHMQARELPDGALIADQGFQNDSVIYMVYREGGGACQPASRARACGVWLRAQPMALTYQSISTPKHE